MIILDDHDWKRVEEDLRTMTEDSFKRNYPSLGYEVEIETSLTTHPWKEAIIIGVTILKNGQMTTHQWFTSVKQAKEHTGWWKA